ncbi:MAG: hypothetical protein AAF902_14440 [Chloroflexota bacterium]
MSKLKPPTLPMYVVIYACVLALFGTYLGISGLINPSGATGFIDGAEVLATGWAGRSLGLGLIMASAIYFRMSKIYVAAFIGAVCRELSDVLGMLNAGETSTVMALLVFLVLDLVGLVMSIRAVQMEE